MAVVVQLMVDAHGRRHVHPFAHHRRQVGHDDRRRSGGLGSAVVSGEVTPDRWVMGKITGEISVRDISDKHIRQVPAPGGGDCR